MSKNVGASVLDRLRNVSKARGVNMQAVLKRYAQERLLYRLSVSGYANNFCVKGGVLLSAYNDGNLLRPSEDIDFNGFFKDGNIEDVAKILRSIIGDGSAEDGAIFKIDTMSITKARDGNIPGGKIALLCDVGGARIEVRVDVGFGNTITPGARKIVMPTLLGETVPQPEVLAYPLETVISEKLHAVFRYGLQNSRLKDFFDVWYLIKSQEFSGQTICDAIVNTFDCHDDPVPTGPMPGLSNEFVEDKLASWKAFLKKIESKEKLDFQQVVEEVRRFAEPVMRAAAGSRSYDLDWKGESGWVTPAMNLAI